MQPMSVAPSEPLFSNSPSIEEVTQRIFTEIDGVCYIGGEKVSQEILNLLKEQARYIQTSQLWEIMSATLIQESVNLALAQSQNYEHVLSAKMLYHWQHVMKNMIIKLAKK